MAIKRNITDISTLKKGANTLSAVYVGSTLIWPTTPPVNNNKWLTNGLNLVLNETVANQDVYVTNGINIKLR